jgi:hypothetical protein
MYTNSTCVTPCKWYNKSELLGQTAPQEPMHCVSTVQTTGTTDNCLNLRDEPGCHNLQGTCEWKPVTPPATCDSSIVPKPTDVPCSVEFYWDTTACTW